MKKTIDKIIKTMRDRYEGTEKQIKHCCYGNVIYDNDYKMKLIDINKLKKEERDYLFQNYNITSGFCKSCFDQYKKEKIKEMEDL